MADRILIAAVEGGGTSFVVVVAEFFPRKIKDHENSNDSNIRILHRSEIDSSHDNPNQTLKECAFFFRKHKSISKDGYRALGVGMFGPFGCNPQIQEEYGTILPTTPKKSWRGVDILSPLIEACECESKSTTKKKLAVKIDTDVNAPALAEYLSAEENQIVHGENNEKTKKLSSLAYVTVGTGIGVGLVIHGKPVHGRMHPEGGHVPVQPLEGDTFMGYSWGANSRSPFRGKLTVESMTSSVALTERLEILQRQANAPATTAKLNMNRDCLADLDDENVLWDHAANALANLCVTLALVTSVEKIVLGGGIMKRNGLIEKIRRQTRILLNGYLGEISDSDLSEWVTSSRYGSDAGIIGALILAQQAITENEEETANECVEGSNIKASSEKGLKQTAYNTGVWHGFILGLSLAYVGLVSYARSGKSFSRR